VPCDSHIAADARAVACESVIAAVTAVVPVAMLVGMPPGTLRVNSYPILREYTTHTRTLATDAGYIVTYLAPAADDIRQMVYLASVNGSGVLGYLDTGANVSVMSADAAMACGLRVVRTGATVLLAGGSRSNIIGTAEAVVHIQAYVDGAPLSLAVPTQFVIMPTVPGGFDMLLSVAFFADTQVGDLVFAQRRGAEVTFGHLPRGVTVLGEAPRRPPAVVAAAVCAATDTAVTSDGGSGPPLACDACGRHPAHPAGCGGCGHAVFCDARCRRHAVLNRVHKCEAMLDADMPVLPQPWPMAAPSATVMAATVAPAPGTMLHSSSFFTGDYSDDGSMEALDSILHETQRTDTPTRDDIAAKVAHILADVSPGERPQVEAAVRNFAAAVTGVIDVFGPLTSAKVEAQCDVRLSDYTVICVNNYRTHTANDDAIKEQIRALEANGVIKRSNSPFNSALVVARKPNGELRLCVDMRRLNAVTLPEVYVMPDMDDLLAHTRGFKLFSTIDIKSAFHQVPVKPDCTKFFAFTTPLGRYEYVKMPFGWKNSPMVFQRIITEALSAPIDADFKAALAAITGEPVDDAADAISAGWVMVYMDDILICSATVPGHFMRLLWVLICLQRKGLRVNLDKCTFLKRSVSFLGQILDGAGRRIDPERLQGLRALRSPRSVAELRRVLGLFNYYSPFVPHMADKVHALRVLCVPNARVKALWGPKEEAAFQQVRDEIANCVGLCVPDFARPFRLRTDASATGIGGYLFQLDDDGNECPIGFYSRKFTGAEERWGTTDREGIAIVDCLRRFSKSFLHPSRQFILETDHANLVYMRDSSNPRVQRWAINMAGYDMMIRHLPGSSNVVADALSRQGFEASGGDDADDDASDGALDDDQPVVQLVVSSVTAARAQRREARAAKAAPVEAAAAPPAPARAASGSALAGAASGPLTETSSPAAAAAAADVADMDEAVPAPPVTVFRDRIVEAQNDPTRSAQREAWDRDPSVTATHLPATATSGARKEYRQAGALLVPVDATALIGELLHAAHDGMGHSDANRTYRHLRNIGVRWPGMAKGATAHASECTICARLRGPPAPPGDVGKMGDRFTPSAPWQAVNIDYAGPFNVGKSKSYVLVIVDMFTRYTVLIPITTADAASTVAGLKQFFGHFGVPPRIYCDSGSHFKNKSVQDMTREYSAAVHYSTPHNPQSNGIVERKMQPLVHMLQTTLYPFYGGWEAHLPRVQLMINSTYSRALGMSPYEALFGVKPRTPLAASVGASDTLGGSLVAYHVLLEERQLQAHARAERVRTAEKVRHDATAVTTSYAPGDIVTVFSGQAAVRDGKFGTVWSGLYTVTGPAPGGGDTYACKDVITGKVRNAHIRAMRRIPKERFSLEEEWARFRIYRVVAVLGHKTVDGALLFLVQFSGVKDPVWQSAVGDDGTGIRSTTVFKDYVKANDIDLRPPSAKRR